jgi:hypothetical protein
MKRLLEIRRRLLVVGALASMATAALFVVPTAGAGGQGGNGCPTGFDIGAVTFQSAQLLPRVAASIAAAGGDTSGFQSFFNTVDRNGDGTICAKTTPAGTANGFNPRFNFFYNFADDNSSATSG